MSAPKPALSLSESQRAQLSFRPVDRNGKSAKLHGVPVWASSDPTVVAVALGKINPDGSVATDSTGVLAVAQGVAPGTARISVSAVAMQDKDYVPEHGVIDVTVSAGASRMIAIDTGSPVEIF